LLSPTHSLGFALLDWIETYLIHGPGDIEGDPIVTDDEFAAFILRCYEIDKDGKRKVRRAVLSRPKGRAKSELAAFIAVAEALGPVRFSHFAAAGEVSPWGYEYTEGEPVGVAVKRPEILCFATEYGQAGNTYDAVRYICATSEVLKADYPGIDVGLTRIILPQGGQITPESAADSSKDGGKSTFVVFDETHLWVLPRLKRLHQVVLRNLLKRKVAAGWAFETTTMYAPGEGSVAEGTHEYAKAVMEGRTADAGLLFDHRQASPKWDATKKRDRLAGLNEVYGPASEWLGLEAIADSYDDPQTSPAEWERYWFNRPVSIQGQWLPQLAWDECQSAREIPDGQRVVLALDGSYSRDATAIAAVSVEQFPHLQLAGVWERPLGETEWTVPILDVEEAIRTACLRWQVVEITADPHLWSRSLEVLAAEGLPVTEFPQSAARMTPATQRFTTMVLERQMTHSGDPVLTRHVSNAVLKSDARGVRIYKENKNSARKIDAAVASIMALERAMTYQEQPQTAAPFFIS
jgi:phage terminase large subunit-like protein